MDKRNNNNNNNNNNDENEKKNSLIESREFITSFSSNCPFVLTALILLIYVCKNSLTPYLFTDNIEK